MDLRVTEIFLSIQGESSWAGTPCVFVRLTGCDLRCVWCDTEYAFHGGSRRSTASVAEEVLAYPVGLVEITGGEPLLQPAEVRERAADYELRFALLAGAGAIGSMAGGRSRNVDDDDDRADDPTDPSGEGGTGGGWA